MASELFFQYNDLPANVWTAVTEFDANRYRSAKYYMQGSAGIEHQTSELFLIHDNDKSYLREIDQVYTKDPYIEFTSNLSNNLVTVLAKTDIANTDLVINATLLEVASPATVDDSISREKVLQLSQSLAGFYPDDNTDYILAQTGSLVNGQNYVQQLQRDVEDMITRLNSPEFAALSEVDQNAYIDNLANGINTLTQTIQNSMDSDIAAFKDAAQKVEAGSIASSIAYNYANPSARQLLDLTLSEEARGHLNK